MCGITGAFRVDGHSAPPLPDHVLRRMTDMIDYRGPDDAGLEQLEGASLGARRLSIIDVEGGHPPFAEVRKLMPGERLVVAGGNVTLERYWDYPAPHADRSDRSAEDWAAEVLDKLDESVRMRLMSDVPLGAMLSGGLDSSLIVAL